MKESKFLLTSFALSFGRRLILALLVIWAVVTLVFVLIHLIPGDPVLMFLGENAQPEEVKQLRHKHGLDLSLSQQYLRLWIGTGKSLENREGVVDQNLGLLRGDLGKTFSGKDVAKQIISRYPSTLVLAFSAMIIAVSIGVPLGIISAAWRGKWLDKGISVVSLLGISLPNFVLGPFVIVVFCVQLGWFPVSGKGGVSHLILPAFTLGVAMAAILVRLVRSSFLEELREDYVRTARAKGVSEFFVFCKHVLKNSMIPVVTVIGLQFGVLLTGAIVTETIFAWPGIGDLTVKAISERDYQQVQGNLLVIALTYVVVNLITDLFYRLLDPRIKIS